MAHTHKDGRRHGAHLRSREFWSRNIGKAKGCSISPWAKRWVSKLMRRQAREEIRNSFPPLDDEGYVRLDTIETNFGAF